MTNATSFSQCGLFVRCPVDNELIKRETIVSDRRLDREIRSHMVYCENRPVGCGVTVELGGYGIHQENCEFKSMECLLECGKRVLLSEMSKHIDECPKQTAQSPPRGLTAREIGPNDGPTSVPSSAADFYDPFADYVNLHVGLDWRGMNPVELYEAFLPFAPIDCVKVMDYSGDLDDDSHYGFVVFHKHDDAVTALHTMNNTSINGRHIRVNIGHQQPPLHLRGINKKPQLLDITFDRHGCDVFRNVHRVEYNPVSTQVEVDPSPRAEELSQRQDEPSQRIQQPIEPPRRYLPTSLEHRLDSETVNQDTPQHDCPMKFRQEWVTHKPWTPLNHRPHEPLSPLPEVVTLNEFSRELNRRPHERVLSTDRHERVAYTPLPEVVTLNEFRREVVGSDQPRAESANLDDLSTQMQSLRTSTQLPQTQQQQQPSQHLTNQHQQQQAHQQQCEQHPQSEQQQHQTNDQEDEEEEDQEEEETDEEDNQSESDSDEESDNEENSFQNEDKQTLVQRLTPLIEDIFPGLSQKIAEMILIENDRSELIEYLESHDLFIERVEQVVQDLVCRAETET